MVALLALGAGMVAGAKAADKPSGKKSIDDPCQKNTCIVIGTGGVRGVYYPAGGAICRFVTRGINNHNIRCFPESTGGSIYNIHALRSGEMGFGIIQSDWQYHAYKGTSEFEKTGPYKDLRTLFSLHSEPFTIVARKDSGIRNLDDLKGKRVNIVNPGSGSRATMEVLMKQKGWSTDVFRLTSELPATEQGQALCDNKIDAFVHATGHPNGLIQEVTSSCEAVLISVSGPDVDKLLKEKPYYIKTTIPGGMYKGTDVDVTTFGIRAALATSSEMNPDVVYQVVKSVFENFDDFRTLHPVFATLKKEDMVRSGIIAPLHPGAIRYYKEAGLMDEKGNVIPQRAQPPSEPTEPNNDNQAGTFQ
jgi:TRAP transporter TAXI family solute receptor